ncbi:hypothetical protein TNCV_2497571 [Trichonephila clavipes]|nr:hypothetical protein TNCV_2497571 [Trichonephila clavipes]
MAASGEIGNKACGYQFSVYNSCGIRVAGLSSQHMQAACVQILANLIRVGLLLSDGSIESLWLNRILAAIRVFSGPPDHLYTALLCVNVLKKKYLKAYSVILKNILYYDQNTTKEPVEYLKVILLFRRLNALVKDPVWNAEITLAVAKVKAPASLESWLRAHNFEMLWDVKSKVILNKLLRKSLDKAILRRLQKVILPEMCLKKISLNRQRNPKASDLFVIDSSKQVQTESRMILTEYNGSSEAVPPTVKKLIKKRKLNFNAIRQGNDQTTSVQNGDEISVANAHEEKRRKKAQKKKSSLIDNIQIESNVHEGTVLEEDCSVTKSFGMNNKKKRKRKRRSEKNSAESIQGIETMNQIDSKDEGQPSQNKIGKIREKYDLCDIKKDSLERKLCGEKICISNSRKLIHDSDKDESLEEISLQKGSPQQTQAAEKSTFRSETVSCSPSVIGKEFENLVVIKDLLDNEDTLNLLKERKGEIVENCERKDKTVEEIDKSILESVELQHSSILPVLEASSKKKLPNYVGNVIDGDINELSDNKNTFGISVESKNKITEDMEIKDEVFEKPILGSVEQQRSLTIPVLEASCKNTSDLQMESKDENSEDLEREEEVIDEAILEGVEQRSLTIPVLEASCKNTSDLQMESKDEITENLEREEEVIDEVILEGVEQQRSLTIPVLESSCKNTSDLQIESKDENSEDLEREEEVIDEAILEGVEQQRSLTIPVLEASCKNTSDLQIESKDEISENLEMEEEVIDEVILEGVEQQRSLTIPVLEASCKNTSDLQIESKDKITEDLEREDEVIDEAILEGVEQRSLTIPVLEASCKNTSDLQMESKDEITENLEREEEVIDGVILEGVEQQRSLTIPVLESSCKNTSDLQIESKDENSEDLEREEEVIDEAILEGVEQQRSLTIPVLEASCKNTSDLQIESKDEISENLEMEEEVIDEVILEGVEQQRSLTIPVLEASCKNTSDLQIESKDKITEDLEREDEVIDEAILEGVEQRSLTIPVLEASCKNTSDLQMESKDEITENLEREEEVIDEVILEGVEQQRSLTIPVLESSCKNTSDLQIESKDENSENLEREEEVIDEAILEGVEQQRSLTIPVLEASCKNTSDLQIESKDEISENLEMEEEVIDEVILEGVEQQRSLTIPVLEASCKNTSDLQIESKDKITEDLEREDEVIDEAILEGVEQRSLTIPVLEASCKNTSDLQMESKDEITENLEREEEVIDEVILEGVEQQRSLTIPVLKASCKNTSDLQIESKDENSEDLEREEEVIDEAILEGVEQQRSLTIPVLEASCKNTSDLQIESKGEITEDLERKDEVIDEAFLKSVGLQRRLTIPVVEASSKKSTLNDNDSNKLISVKQSEIKSVNYSVEMNKSGSSIVESNSNGIIEDCSLKNTELDPQSSNLIIVENYNESQGKTFPNDTVDYIMGKMLRHLEQADHSVKDCSFETLKHNILKSGIKITPNKSLSVTNYSKLESSPLLKKASNLLSFLDLSLEKSSPSKTKNTRHHESKVTEFSFYRDFLHDAEDIKSEDSLLESQNKDKIDVDEFSSDDCSNDSDVSEINESTQVSLLSDVCKIDNSGNLPDNFHGKNNFSDSSEQSFISRNSKEKEIGNETNCQVYKIDVLEKDDIRSISPNVDSCVESKKYKRLSPVVNLEKRCDSGDLNENNSKTLNSCINSAAERDFDDKNNSYSPENLMLQGNQIEDCDLHENRMEAINKKSSYVVLSDCVKKPFDSKIDIPKSPLHLTDSQIEMSFSSVCENSSFTKSENQVKSQDQFDSCSSDLAEHNSATEPSFGMKLRKRTIHTACIEKSAPVVEEVHVKSSDTKQVKTSIDLACRTSLRNRNFTHSCKSLDKGGVKSLPSKSWCSKKLKKEVNQNLGFDFSLLSLDSPKKRSCRLREPSIKNIPEEQKDSVVMKSEIQPNSVSLNEENEKVCQKSSGSSTAASMEVDSQKSNNQVLKRLREESPVLLVIKGYNLRSRNNIILPGKLKLERKS